MVETMSTDLPLGTPAPDFSLVDTVSGRKVSLGDFEDAPALLVMFICNHCPYVIHIRERLGTIAQMYQKKGVAVVAINSNDVEAYPDDRPEEMRRIAREKGWTFPYLFDETQEVARAYRAACTPDFYLFDRDRKLVYHGQLDRSRPNNGHPVTGEDLRTAMERLLHGLPPLEKQVPSTGCNIKWKPGNEPSWFGHVA